MPDTNRCAECGVSLPAFWPKGLCTVCAIDGALDMTHAGSQVLQPEASAAPASFQAPQSGGENAPLGSFGDYDLLEEIARGGMGVVYKARQSKLGRIVAVKMIQAGPLAGKEFVQRFRTESAAAAILQHPNIVAIHDVGVHEGRHYFSMDYVEGPNLVQRVGQQPLPANKAAGYVEIIAKAIHYAHERGILHRDLKPSNVLIDSNDQPRITDFGLARRLDGESSLTMSGHVLGSPNFMPPEQAGAKRGKVGRPSDVYALGGILYYLLTARAPFQADSLEHTITQVINVEPVSPRLLNPSVPRDLETITLKCLEKEPSRRYQTAQELADELGRVLRHEPIRARPITQPEKLWRWCRRKPALTSAVVFAIAALVIGLATTSWQWRRAERLAASERHERQRAEAGESNAVRQIYIDQLNLAQAAWEQNNIIRMRGLLDETASAPQRGFEWYYWQRHMHLELLALRGHTGPILAVAYSRDGRRIATGSADKSARVWDAETGLESFRLEGHTDSVRAVAFSRDGQRIVTGSWDRTVRVWDAATGRSLRSIVANGKEVFSVAFSPDGQRIVSGGQEEKARVWDANSGDEIFPLEGHTNLVWAVAFSEDGRRIVTGSWDQTAKVWDAATGEHLCTLIGHRGAVLSVAFSPDGQRVVTGGQDHRAKVWDAVNGTTLFTLKGHSAVVFSVSFSRDGKRILTNSDDQTARLWDAASGEELRVFKGHGSRIGSAALSPDGQRIVTGGGAVRFAPEGIAFNPTTGDDHAAKVWDATDTREVLTLSGHEKDVVSVDVSADGRFVASGSFDGTARVWDIRTGQEVSRMTGHEAPVRGVAFFPDGKRLVTGGFDGTARIWDIASRREIHRLEGHAAQVFSVAVSPDSRWIATSGWDHTVRVWDGATGQPRHKFDEASPSVFGVAFSPDSRQVGSANVFGMVRLWDPDSGREYPGFRDTRNIWSLAFSRDGRRIVTGSHGLIAKVWDAGSGQQQITLEGHAAHIHAAVFSPDGRRIVTGSADQTAKLWDAVTGRELLTLKGHNGAVFSVAFTPDGQRIVTGSGDGTVKVWEAATQEQVAKWREEERTASAAEPAPGNPD
jgi:WD40 repeat protein/serine/threonine protein kinase